MRLIITLAVMALLIMGGVFLITSNQKECPFKDIPEGENCTLYNSFKGYCEKTGETSYSMDILGCICKEDKQLFCSEDIKNN